jgi:hypothetical protein
MSDDNEIKAKLAEAQIVLEALQSGKLYIGAPYEWRTETKIYTTSTIQLFLLPRPPEVPQPIGITRATKIGALD